MPVPTDAPSDRPPRAPLLAAAHLSAYLVGSLVWVFLLNVFLVAGLLLGTDLDLGALAESEALMRAMGPGLLGLVTLVQGFGLVALAAGLAALLPSRAPATPEEASAPAVSLPEDRSDLRARWRRAFALRRSRRVYMAAGAVGALTVGWLPAWIAERLIERMPDGYVSMVELLPRILQEPSPGRVVLLAGVVLGAPILEELIFRGYVWEVLQRAGPPIAAWLGSSLLFALYHQDPVHIIALLPTALFIGWLRLASGSLWPPVAAHFVNNGLSALAILTSDGESAMSMPISMALTGFGFTIAVCVVAWLWARRRPEPA